jgi:membrane protease YdiL (CAAX protease family)
MHQFLAKQYAIGSNPAIGKALHSLQIKSWVLVLVLALLPWGAIAGAASTLDEQLFKAAKAGNAQEVRALLEKGADPNAKDREGVSALMRAAYRANLETIWVLTERGADVNARDDEGLTPLMVAALRGNLSGVEALLEKGADVNAQSERGLTPLIWASSNGHIEIVRLLLNKGVDAKVKDAWGYTASTSAAKKGYTEIAELLRDREGPSSKRSVIGVSSKRSIIGGASKLAMILGTLKLILLVIFFVLIARMHEGHALAAPFFESQRWSLNDAYRIIVPLVALNYLVFMIHRMLPQYEAFLTLVFAPIYCIVMYGAYCFFTRNAYRASAISFGLDKVKFLRSGVRNANIALAIVLLFIICDPGATATPVETSAEHLNLALLLNLIIFLVVVFAVPVLEELLFRGILYAPVARRIGAWKAMGLVSVVGSLSHVHYTAVETLYTIVIFFLLCYGYVRSTSLYGPIIWHATLNFVVFRSEVATALTGYVGGQTLDRYYICGLFLLLLVVNSLWLAMILKKVNPDQRGTNRCCAKKE